MVLVTARHVLDYLLYLFQVLVLITYMVLALRFVHEQKVKTSVDRVYLIVEYLVRHRKQRQVD